MAGQSTNDIPAALAAINFELSRFTIDKLKAVLRQLNDNCGQYLKMTGKKMELFQRCQDTIAALSRSADTSKFWTARRIVSGQYTDTGPNHYFGGAARAPAHDPYGVNGWGMSSTANSSASGYRADYQAPPRPQYPAASYNNGYNYNAASTSSANHGPARNPLPPPRFAPNGTSAAASSAGNYPGSGYGGAAGQAPPQKYDEIPLRFRPNPFYRVDKSLSGVCQLPRAGEGDRKSVRAQFALTEAQRNLLTAAKASASNKQYQVRLYCTSESYFNQARPASNQLPAPMEFPTTCEIRLNNIVVPASTKGIKKQVGTASPVNLGKTSALNLSSGVVNQLDMIYTNSDKISKKYFMVVYLVEVTSIKTLVDRVKEGKTKTPAEVVESIIKINADPDLEASSFGVSLRDPLTMGRLKTPIRSEACTHISCFDAEIWFTINEQTPTWTCPICSKALRVDELIVDGYLQDALKICSSEVDGIIVNPDGTWRSDDDKHGTAPPKSKAPSRAESASRGGSMKPDAALLDGALNGHGAADKGKSKLSEEALLLDSDDEDSQPLAKRQRLNGVGLSNAISLGSSPIGSPRVGNPASKRMDTIDLTLSDSEDDARPSPPRPALALSRPPPPAQSHSFPGLPPKPVPPTGFTLDDSALDAQNNARIASSSLSGVYGGSLSPLPPRPASAGPPASSVASTGAAAATGALGSADRDRIAPFGSEREASGGSASHSTTGTPGEGTGFSRFSDSNRMTNGEYPYYRSNFGDS